MIDTVPAAPVAAARPGFARLPVFLVAGVTGALMLLASRNYGYFFDEAYFVVAGRDHGALGYFDQPPLIPFLAGASDALFPGSLPALRLPATAAATAGVVLTGLIARELGGRRVAQAVAALGMALSGTSQIAHYLATYSVDPFFWTAIVFLLVRWTRQRCDGVADDRLLLAAGVVTAVSLQTKFLVPALWVAVLVCALVFGPRELPRRPLLWLGAAVAAVATVPTLWWQAANGWPYLRMSDVVAREFPGAGPYLSQALLGAGLPLGVLLVVAGVVRLVGFRSPFRYLGVATLVLVVAFLVASGRPNYVYGLYALPLAAGAVWAQDLRWPTAAKWAGGAVVLVSIAQAAVVLPVYPVSVAQRLPAELPLGTLTARAVLDGERLLDPLRDAMAQTYRALPEEQRAHTAIMTDSYVFAAAFDLRAAEQGLPRAYSTHRGYFHFGAPPESADSVLFFGDEQPEVRRAFTGSVVLVPDFATLYTGRTESWGRLWPGMRSQ
ncbi:glycosyltransferase family 39 protein [Actinokineospora sp. PR83]|uniref:ArnT family glycosyltransferase n=1 Tax=Actinokineospora sp. PR83 TaxID=2884908 RepID=UPI001F2DE2FD|nr:glycosyltransferase family 39 protein [Actinokineospora sp. PR83]MCG8915675.1 glycosyltransferase family 39 protein [Actinokineospora sp. PR83]